MSRSPDNPGFSGSGSPEHEDLSGLTLVITNYSGIEGMDDPKNSRRIETAFSEAFGFNCPVGFIDFVSNSDPRRLGRNIVHTVKEKRRQYKGEAPNFVYIKVDPFTDEGEQAEKSYETTLRSYLKKAKVKFYSTSREELFP